MKIIIIGAGPGGMDTAIEARKKGHEVLVIEKDLIGGTCLNRGCIPTKALLNWAQRYELLNTMAHSKVVSNMSFSVNPREAALEKEKVVDHLRQGAEFSMSNIPVVKGEARLKDIRTVEVDGVCYEADRIIIATGSEPSLLNIPGVENTINSNDVLSWTAEWEKSFKSIAIIGGGVIGIEFATIFKALLPDANVSVIEYCKEILPPFDKEISKRLRLLLIKKGINIITSANVTSIASDKTVFYNRNNKEECLAADVVVMATGRKPVFPDGLNDVGVTYTHKGIFVDDKFETSVPGIFAIGDVNGKCMLAHAATAQGKKVLGQDIDLEIIPSVVFSIPECAMVGKTEDECKDLKLNFKIKKSLYRSNGKAVCSDATDGLMKVIVNTDTKQIVGVHIMGEHASDIIAEAALAMSNNIPIDGILKTIHAHPTLSELFISALNE